MITHLQRITDGEKVCPIKGARGFLPLSQKYSNAGGLGKGITQTIKYAENFNFQLNIKHIKTTFWFTIDSNVYYTYIWHSAEC